MPTTVPQPRSSTPRNSIDAVRPRAAKATLPGQPQSTANPDGQPSSVRLTAIVKNALQRHYGTLKGAAYSMAPPMDPAQLTRELQTGDFKLEKLERLDADGQAFVAATLHEAFGDVDPKTQARRLIREARARLDELAEVVA